MEQYSPQLTAKELEKASAYRLRRNKSLDSEKIQETG
jgi:hypothetical protein